ncbi:hypothetical protein [Thermovenabulum gondwanense]|uniref:Uncharacterized protein n=1 Tax=Thermovenabulum gondwanense TaxID=520767 RepID=A0A162MVF1_9FIRM|nr:hypothetical protein [Thermovenabulum gondwanense]KYO67818.1 hypothetical protein ATZ99_04580 [Thermovenabulum gondwanense]
MLYDYRDLSRDLITANGNFTSCINLLQDNYNQFTGVLKDLHDKLRRAISNTENNLKQLELEISQNNGTLAKLLAGSNQKLQQEQVSKRRMDIINELSEIEKQLENLNRDFSNSVQNIVENLNKQMLTYREMENKVKTGLEQVNSSEFSMVSPNPVLAVNQSIQTAIDTLNKIRQNIAENKVLNEITNTLDNIQ